jgi:succinate dehydrogenase / fumarate reductase membrane anchor subunit
MKIHYLTGLAAIVLVGIHVSFRLIMPYGMSLEYENVIANYKNLPYSLVLELVLVTVAIHGFNGLRIILIELRQGNGWERAMTWLCIAGAIAVIAYGTRTIIYASIAGEI